MQIVRVESRAAARCCGPFFLPRPFGYWEKPVQLFVYWVLALQPSLSLAPEKKYYLILFVVDMYAVIAYINVTNNGGNHD